MHPPEKPDKTVHGAPATEERPNGGSRASRISREIVRLHARLYGRGPTRAKTYVNEDFAMCLLEEVFTPAERTLIKTGNPSQVQATRSAFQEAVEEEFVEIVTRITGREIKAFLSQVHIGTDAAVEIFFFEPRGGEGSDEHPPRGTLGEPA